MILYQRVELIPPLDVGDPGPLPVDLQGLDDASLADVTAAVGVDAATQLGYLNTGFLPVEVPSPPSDQAVTQVQYRLGADSLGHLTLLESSAATAGGDIAIRWGSQVVIEPGEAWLNQLVLVEAGLTQLDYDAIFAAARGEPDPLRNALNF